MFSYVVAVLLMAPSLLAYSPEQESDMLDAPIVVKLINDAAFFINPKILSHYLSRCPIELLQLLTRLVHPRYLRPNDACSDNGLLLPGNEKGIYLKCKKIGGSTMKVKYEDFKRFRDLIETSRINGSNNLRNHTISDHSKSVTIALPLYLLNNVPGIEKCGTFQAKSCAPGLQFDFFRQTCSKDVLISMGFEYFVSLIKSNVSSSEIMKGANRLGKELIQSIPDILHTLLTMAKDPTMAALGTFYALNKMTPITYTTLLDNAVRAVNWTRETKSTLIDRVVKRLQGVGQKISYLKKIFNYKYRLDHSHRQMGVRKLSPNDLLNELMSTYA